jgi:protein TonB
MRFFPALLGAILITVAIFMFMQSLIKSRQEQDVVLPLHTLVEMPREEPEQEQPEPEEEPPEEPLEEPIMEALEMAPPTPEPAPELEINALDLDMGDIRIQSVGDRWSGPVGSGTVPAPAADAGGEDAQGYIEVIPFDTRRPNVPDVAWENRISGWVLVAFRVRSDGTTHDIKVLDANPRGVFEEKVVAAVADWRYRVNFYGKASGSVVLTQKVPVDWQTYPQNMPNVD